MENVLYGLIGAVAMFLFQRIFMKKDKSEEEKEELEQKMFNDFKTDISSQLKQTEERLSKKIDTVQTDLTKHVQTTDRNFKQTDEKLGNVQDKLHNAETELARQKEQLGGVQKLFEEKLNNLDKVTQRLEKLTDKPSTRRTK
jgi:DNA repair ATPase RecN